MKAWQWVGLTVVLSLGSAYLGFRAGQSKRAEGVLAGPPAPKGAVLATFDGHVIDIDAFTKRLAGDGPLTRCQMKNPEALSRYLEDWIRVSVMAARAREMGIADRPEIRRETERRLAAEYLKATLTHR